MPEKKCNQPSLKVLIAHCFARLLRGEKLTHRLNVISTVDMDEEMLQELLQRFLKFRASDIQDLRFQFQCFDHNSDGLIDKAGV